MEIINIMDRKSLEIYGQKKAELDAGVLQQARGGKDVISGLREHHPPDELQTDIYRQSL
jgi:hypothetical protein